MKSPRLFFNHCKKDRAFVMRMKEGLEKCKIEFWFDEDDIELGEEWQEKIFGDALPNCDGLFAYVTPHTFESHIAKKELDAANISALERKDPGRFIFVDNETTRDQLRSDFRLVQIKIWNEDNFNDMLPAAASRIWRWWGDQLIHAAANAAEASTAKAELRVLELESERGGSLFSPKEVSHFQYVADKLDRFEWFRVETQISTKRTDEESVPHVNSKGPELKATVRLLSLLPIMQMSSSVLDREAVEDALGDGIEIPVELVQLPEDASVRCVKIRPEFRLTGELERYGLLDRETLQIQYAPRIDDGMPGTSVFQSREALTSTSDRYAWSELMGRFCLWLDFEGRSSTGVERTDWELA